MIEHSLSPDVVRQPTHPSHAATSATPAPTDSLGEAEDTIGDNARELYSVLPDALSASEATIPVSIPLADAKPERTPEEEEVCPNSISLSPHDILSRFYRSRLPPVTPPRRRTARPSSARAPSAGATGSPSGPGSSASPRPPRPS